MTTKMEAFCWGDGVSPTQMAPNLLAGLEALLEEFWKTKNHVKYGQCWVFSGLVTTCELPI